MYSYIQSFVNAINQIENFDPREIIGCSEEDIAKLNHCLPEGSMLPESLVEFYKYCGHQIAYLLPFDNFYFDSILSLNRIAQEQYSDPEFYQEGFEEVLPPDAFVIAERDDEAFWFVRVSQGPNPPVYYWDYNQPQTHFVEAYPLFTAFLDWIASQLSQKHELFKSGKYPQVYGKIRKTIPVIYGTLEYIKEAPEYPTDSNLQVAHRNFSRLGKQVYLAYPQNSKKRFIKKIDLDLLSGATGLINNSTLQEMSKARILTKMRQVQNQIADIYN